MSVAEKDVERRALASEESPEKDTSTDKGDGKASNYFFVGCLSAVWIIN